jgi:[pyruvate, water dikinase]-phosphate phosphotransferase / [pyruvate, water dikinase] kinase
VKHCDAGASNNEADVIKRTVFFVSDQTGITAETMGHSLMTQFDGIEFRQVTVPFISTVDKAIEAVRKIDLVAKQEGVRPIVFSTLVQEDVRNVVRASTGFFLDFFDPFLSPLENELKTQSHHLTSRSHRMADTHAYAMRIDATNFAMANDDGSVIRDYERADVILVGVSRSGKTPTCLYLAMQYGIFAANYPLTEDDLESRKLPAALESHARKIFALTIKPDRLQQIRNERRPDSRYSSTNQVAFEVRAAESLFERTGIPVLDVTECSIEEISSRILDRTGIERRLRP